MSANKRKAAETVRPRIFAFVALLGAVASVLGAAAAPQALAAPSIKLEVNQNCVDPNWPCWTTETSVARPQPALKVMIAEGDEVEFVEHNPTLNFKASVNWIGTAPACTGVPTTAGMDWEGTCTFAHPGTYMFESSTMFNDSNTPYGDANYTKYEVVVEAARVAGAPVVTTDAATGVTETQATLDGGVNPNSQATSYYFEWGSSESYGNTTSELQVGSDDSIHIETATLSGLEAGKVYHFRIVAKNPSETVTGSDQRFTTASPPPPKEPAKEPPAKEPPAKEPPAKEPSPTPTPTGGNLIATTSSSPSSGQPAAEPASGELFGSVKLASTQHSSVHGTIDISQAGVGGQLEVALLSPTASLAKAKHSSKARVGRFLRSSLKAGVVSFTLPLTSKAKSALRRHKHLALTVQIVITPVHGAAVTVTKSVVLHA